MPLSIYRQYESTGVDPESGLWTFKDVNSDGAITRPEDDAKVVFVGQDFYGGLNNSFTFDGWSLDIFFQFVKQTGSGNALGSVGLPGGTVNIPSFLLDKKIWRAPGDHADIQRLFANNPQASDAFANYRYSDQMIVDASFIRLKNVSISYHLPEKWTRHTKCRIYFQGQNLLLITQYKGDDPENQRYESLPPLRMFTMGVQISL
jgi:hypothetical protein